MDILVVPRIDSFDQPEAFIPIQTREVSSERSLLVSAHPVASPWSSWLMPLSSELARTGMDLRWPYFTPAVSSYLI